MTQRKIIYSETALAKRKAVKRDIKEKYGREFRVNFRNVIIICFLQNTIILDTALWTIAL